VNPNKSFIETIRVTTHNVGTAKKALEYGWLDFASRFDSDVICLQSLNLAAGDQRARALATGYQSSFALGDMPPSRYGVGILSRRKLNTTSERPKTFLDQFGQWIIVKEGGIWFASVYATLKHSPEQHATVLSEIAALPIDEPVILAGDFNTIQDLKLDANQPGKGDGYNIAERTWVKNILDMGFIDAYRNLHTDQHGYTWWQSARLLKEDRGTRIDLQLVRGLTPVAATIHREWSSHRVAAGGGPDHAPLTIEYRR